MEAHRELVRRGVFDALVALLAERSFDAVSMADLAARAGVGRTAIYNHFPDKESVVVAFAESETQRYLDDLGAALEGAVGPAEAMRVYVRHHLESSSEFHFGLGPGLYGLLSRESLGRIREHVVAVEGVLRGIVDDGISDGTFQVTDVDAALGLVHASLQARAASENTEAAQEWILRGLGAGDRAS